MPMNKSEKELYEKTLKEIGDVARIAFMDNGRWKSGWCSLSPKLCLGRVEREIKEIETSLLNQKPEDAIREIGDVINYLIFLKTSLEEPSDEMS